MAKKLTSYQDKTEAVIRENYNDIYRYCYWKTGNIADAQDIAQETFMRFIKNLPNYKDQGKPQALLYTIARNLCANRRREKKPCPLDNYHSTEDTSSQNMIKQVEDKLLLQRHIDDLPTEQQEAILLRYGQELKINDIAAITGTSRFVVMYRIRNALATLKKKLNQGG